MKKSSAVLSPILLCLLALFFPGSSAAQSFRVGVRLANQGMQQSQSAAVPLSAFNTDFTMLPSVFGTRISPYGGGPQTLNLVLFCYTLPTGNIIPNCDITVVPSAEANSGGHLHNTNRPAGTFTPDHGNSGPSGFLPVSYTAPQASGIINVTETGSPNGFPPFGTIFTIGIEFDGLQPASVSGFVVDTQSNMHGNNNGNATPQMAAALQDTADLFADLLAQAGEKLPALHVTALSLPQGGLFVLTSIIDSVSRPISRPRQLPISRTPRGAPCRKRSLKAASQPPFRVRTRRTKERIIGISDCHSKYIAVAKRGTDVNKGTCFERNLCGEYEESI